MSDKAKVLIIDDDCAFRQATVAMLRLEGYDCDCAVDAEEAIKLLQSISYNLVLTDINMHGNRDLALIRKIPQLQADIPVIIVTAYPTAQTVIESLKLAVSSYFVKPADTRELLAEMRKWIEHHRILSNIRKNRLHVRNWLKDLESLEDVTNMSKGEHASELDEAYLTLIIKNITQSVDDLLRFSEFLTKRRIQQIGHEEQNTKEKETVVQTLRKGATVIEKSRASFKSKELGDLRRELGKLADSMDQDMSRQ